MALQVWLPLIKNIHNYGCSDVEFINTGAAYSSTGKLGGSYEFMNPNNPVAANVLKTSIDIDCSKLSMSCWIYINQTAYEQDETGCNIIGCLNDSAGSNDHAISMMTNRDGGGYFFEFVAGGKSQSYRYNTANVFNKWVHVTTTFDGTTVKGYFNGQVVASRNDASSLTRTNLVVGGRSDSSYLSAYRLGFNGKLCDFRLYNHCLSATEVKEISKGLMLHYKLDDVHPNPNLLLDSNASSLTKIYAAKDRYFESATSGTYTCVFERIADPPVPGIKYGVRETVTSATQFHSVTFYQSGNVGVTAGKVYTMSCYVKNINSSSNLTFVFQHGRNPYSNERMTLMNDNKWHQYSMTFTADAETDLNDLTRIYCGGLASVGEVLICGYKLEEGSVATPWIPNVAEADYALLVNNVASDSSGYNRHGTIVGNPVTNLTPAKYSSCAYFADGTVSNITTPSLNFDPQEITLNIWFKGTNTSPTGNYHMMVDSVENRGWYEMDVYKDGRYRAGVYVNGTRRAETGTINTCLDGNWHMFTLKYDGVNVSRYVDAKLDSTTEAAYTTGLSSPTAIKLARCGDNSNYAVTDGSLSDFRIYATSLSDADILRLYQTGMKADNDGYFHSNEIKEADKESFSKTGLTTARNITEVIPNLHYDKNIYKEPDGSLWVKVARYNKPSTNGIFESTDDFPNGVYKNENTWYDAEQVFANISIYEFLTVQAATVGNTVWKHRWVQTVSPLTATYSDVSPTSANITRVTTDGYSDSTTGGGLYIKMGQTRLCITDSSSGHYYGAFGTWTLSSDKVPGYPGHTGITTGFLELYVRIDNQPNSLNIKLLKNAGIYANQFIEM